MTKNFALLLALPFLFGKSSNRPNFDDYEMFRPRIYVAQHEVSNGEYRNFLRGLNKEELAEFKVDSSAWIQFTEFAYHDHMVENYHSHPAYNDYPVVNISQKAAEAYCQWLTEQYYIQKKREFQKVQFRLPSSEEWMSFASPLPNNRLPWYGNLPYTPEKDGQVSDIICNIKLYDYRSGKHNYIADGGFYPVKVGSYPANQNGLFDIIGNVAEMTSDSLIKGGSWDNSIEESFIDLEQNFSLPDPRVGFRIVMEVLEP